MKNIRLLVLIIAAVLTTGVGTSYAAELHVIIITDTDPNIGSTKDKVLISELADQVGRITNMTVNKQVFNKTDNGYLSAIQNLNPGRDDVVWVYYSGHGRNSGNGWPEFINGDNRFKLTSVKSAVEAKSARLNIIIYDCCNHGATVEEYPGARLTPAALDILFRNAKGTVIASGADAGRYGHGSPQIGGFFTVSFIKALNEVSPADGNNLWNVVLENAKRTTNGMCRRFRKTAQNPKFNVTMTNDSSCDVPTAIAPEKDNPNAKDPF